MSEENKEEGPEGLKKPELSLTEFRKLPTDDEIFSKKILSKTNENLYEDEMQAISNEVLARLEERRND